MRLWWFLLVVFTLTACGEGTADPAEDDEERGDQGTTAYMATCEPAEDQCADGLVCFLFNNKGPHCTHGCETPADCEEPSAGCNGMGVCKAPEGDVGGTGGGQGTGDP